MVISIFNVMNIEKPLSQTVLGGLFTSTIYTRIPVFNSGSLGCFTKAVLCSLFLPPKMLSVVPCKVHSPLPLSH